MRPLMWYGKISSNLNRHAGYLMATLKTPSPTQLPWEGFWLSYRKYFNQFCEDGASLPDTEDVPIRIIANEAPGRIEFHRYKIEDIVIHQADVVDRIVVVELTPVLSNYLNTLN